MINKTLFLLISFFTLGLYQSVSFAMENTPPQYNESSILNEIATDIIEIYNGWQKIFEIFNEMDERQQRIDQTRKSTQEIYKQVAFNKGKLAVLNAAKQQEEEKERLASSSIPTPFYPAPESSAKAKSE